MKRLKRILICSFVALLPTISFAQSSSKDNRSLIGGAGLHSYGIQFTGDYLLHRSNLSYVFHLGLANFKHPKQLRVASGLNDSETYIRDKSFYVYTMTPLFGLQKVLISRGEQGDVDIRVHVALGPSVALLKPYYVDVYDGLNDNVKAERYDSRKHNTYNIEGQSKFGYGLDELQTRIGIGFLLGTQLNWADRESRITGVDAGIRADIYSSPIAILETGPVYSSFVGLYLNFIYGHNW